MSSNAVNPALVDLSSHYDELLAFVMRRVQCRATAADIVQDSYLRFASLPSHEHDAVRNPRAYLFRTAANLVSDHWRHAGRRGESLDDSEATEPLRDLQPSPEARALSHEELSVLAAAIESLPPRTREVFHLHKFEHLSYGDIAERLGIAKNTVVVHMVRALAHCRAQLAAYRRETE